MNKGKVIIGLCGAYILGVGVCLGLMNGTSPWVLTPLATGYLLGLGYYTGALGRKQGDKT